VVTATALPPPEPLLSTFSRKLTWIVTDDGSGVGLALVRALERRNQAAILMRWPERLAPRPDKVPEQTCVVDLSGTREEDLRQAVSAIVDRHGPVAGFIHVHPMRPPPETLATLLTQDDLDLGRAVFRMAKILEPQLVSAGETGQAFFASVVRCDGALGHSGGRFGGISGLGLLGLVRSLVAEWRGTVTCRMIDVACGWAPTDAAEAVCEELAHFDRGRVEVGRGPTGRFGLERVLASLPKEIAFPDRLAGNPSDPRPVFVVTGGGRGICADCAVALANRLTARFVLMGRSSLSPEEPEWAVGIRGEAELKRAFVANLRDVRPTKPIDIERAFRQVTNLRDIRQTLARIEKTGSTAEYIGCDVTDADRVASTIRDVEARLGPITGIIHGAGVLADRKLSSKTDTDFESVVSPKVFGLVNLLSALGSPPRFLMLFSSVVGQFGNIGQTDYAYANATLDSFALAARALAPDVQTVSIAWGPWESGMVTPLHRRLYEQRGIVLIPKEEGPGCLANELLSDQGRSRPQVLICGAGDYRPEITTPLVGKVFEIETRLRLEENPFLKDHVINEKPVLPITCEIGWMSRVGEGLLPRYEVASINDFQVYSGILFDGSQDSTFRVRAEVVSAGEEPVLEIAVSSLEEKKRRIIERKRFGGRLTFRPVGRAVPEARTDKIELPREGEPGGLYGEKGLLFHGPTFAGVRAWHKPDAETIVSRCRILTVPIEKRGNFPVTSFNPYISDVELHNTLIWCRSERGALCLPLVVKSLERLAPLCFDHDFFVTTRIRSSSKGEIVADCDVHGEDGRLFARWTGIQLTVLAKPLRPWKKDA